MALAIQVVFVLAAFPHPSAPAPPPPVANYTVRDGDNLTQLSRRFGLSVATLAAANAIKDGNRLRVGQVLSVPRVGEPEPAAASKLAPLPSAVVVAGGGTRHRVAAGQTLEGIAARYGTTIAALVATNGLRDANRIREGTSLEIPGPAWLCPVQGSKQFSDSWGAPRPNGRRHLGVDVFAVRGTPVVASVGGVLEHIRGSRAGLAFYLRGDDGNTYYGAHLDALDAPPGRIERAARIGSVGSSGNARGTTPHLHFEVKPGGGPPVNPMPTLERWCR